MNKVTVVLKPKENIMQSLVKDLITFSFIIFSIYVSQGGTFWTFVTGLMLIFMFAVKLKSFADSNLNEFDNVDDAIKYINTKSDEL